MQMIDKLKWLIDQCEDKPKIKEILLKVAQLPEDKQGLTLDFLEEFLKAKDGKQTKDLRKDKELDNTD